MRKKEKKLKYENVAEYSKKKEQNIGHENDAEYWKKKYENDIECWMKKYKKLSTKSFIAIVILVVLLLTSTIGMYGYAKYMTGINGGASAYVAQWNVKVTMGNNGVDGEFTDGATIDMASTAVTNSYIQSGKVAPGSKGQIILNVDAKDCETAVSYAVTMNTSNLPTNMKFYSDPGYSVPFTLENGNIVIRGTLSIDEKNNIVPAVIYWDWPFTTGTSVEEKDANDIVDTRYMGQTLTADVSVTVAQVNGYGSGETLASIGRVGEYVNYDATSGNGAGRSITPSSSLTGSNQTTTFNSSDITRWRIYDIDSETGAVTLIAADPTSKTLTLSNKTGWKNAIEVLNSVGDIYGHGNGGAGGRSISEIDISAKSTYNPANYTNNQHTIEGINIGNGGTADNLGYYYYTGNTSRYETQTYTSGTFIMDDNSEVTATESSPVTMRQTYYGYRGSSYIANPYYNLIFRQSTNTSAWKPNFWVAARYVNLSPSGCDFGVRRVYSGNVSYYSLYYSSGSVGGPSYAVVPMVTLQSNIQVTGMDANGVWLLDV